MSTPAGGGAAAAAHLQTAAASTNGTVPTPPEGPPSGRPQPAAKAKTEKEEQEQVATKIQAVQRGNVDRKRVEEKKKEEKDKKGGDAAGKVGPTFTDLASLFGAWTTARSAGGGSSKAPLDGKKHIFLFVFAKMPGDVNPSFPVARTLVEKGHQVYYMSPDYQAAIEDTGAKFLDATKYYDLYKEGRTPETFGAASQLKKELGMPETDGEYLVRMKICHVELQKKLPGLLQAIDEIKATAIVYDPVLCKEAPIAAEICKLPVAALLAFNGHGAWAELVKSKITNECPGIEDENERNKKYEEASMCPVNQDATKSLNEKYKDKMKPLDGKFTGGRLDPVPDICVVTTTESMKVAETSDLAGTSKVHYVGALLDTPGALRAGGPSTKELWRQVEKLMQSKKDGGRIIFVSMGTVTTADGDLGWQGKPDSSLTGELLCQAVWGGALDALGECGSDKKNVVLITMGKDASGLPRPMCEGDEAGQYCGKDGNALSRASMPQVDILATGIDLFVTHGGQNSFVESITLQTPMLVVPTVGDQIDNAAKAVKMGIGEKVDRPPPSDEDPKAVAAKYRKDVKDKILAMLEPSNYQKYKDAVVKESSAYRGGGVAEAAQVLESL